MKVLRIYNQHRRDCWVDLECESCGHQETYEYGYDDRNFWDNVVPSFKCSKCKKSTNDTGGKVERIQTKYPFYQQV